MAKALFTRLKKMGHVGRIPLNVSLVVGRVTHLSHFTKLPDFT
jgi:hypothetical protein